MCNMQRSNRITVIADGLKAKPGFSAVHMEFDQNTIKVMGSVQREADFILLTNFLSSVAKSVSIEVWIDWPVARDPTHLTGGMIATTIGTASEYGMSNLSSLLLVAFAVFLFCLISTVFWCLWKFVCVQQKPQRDLPVLIFSPFFSAISVFAIWWNLPSKGTDGNLWLILLFLLINTALFNYCLYSMLKKRYCLLSLFGVAFSCLATLPEYLLFAIVAVEPFIK